MDLIYANAEKKDIGVLLNYDFDLAFGKDENDFSCTIDTGSHCCEKGFFLYMERTEYGGIIDDVEVDTASSELTYHGRTWHGILGTKVIVPLKEGESSTSTVTLKETDSSGNTLVDSYLIVSGEANAVLGWIIERIGLSSMFSSSSDDSGITISNYQFDRYTDGYSGIAKMLKSEGAKLKIVYSAGSVVISAVPVVDYTKDEQFNSDQMEMKVKKIYNPVNHLICLGKGDLAERQVIHLYADSNGNISTTQSMTGIDEVVAVYDYSSAESLEELKKSGIEKLQEAWNSNKVNLNFDSDTESYDIGDLVRAEELITGITSASEITKKIVKIKNGITTISYKIGE